MNKVQIIYKSKYGASKKYAKALSAKTNAVAYELEEIRNINLELCTTIVYIAGVYAGMMNGISKLMEIEALKNKKIIVCAVGLTKKEEKQKIVLLKQQNIDKYNSNHIEFVYLEGTVDITTLKFAHKIIIKAILSSQKKKGNEIRLETSIDEKAIDQIINKLK